MRLAKSAKDSSPWRSFAKRSVSRLTTSGTRFDGTAPMARPYEPPLFVPLAADDQLEVRHAAPADVAATPRKPMSATWCCAHELKQPLALMCRPLRVRVLVDARRAQLLAQLGRQRARRRDAQLARVGARAGAMSLIVAGARRGRGRSPSAPRRRRAGPPRSTQRSSMFWSAVVRMVSPVYLRATSASARACSRRQVAERQRDAAPST